MPTLIAGPARVEAAGGHEAVSVAHIRSPGGWAEPGQTPEFDELTVILPGRLPAFAPQLAHRDID